VIVFNENQAIFFFFIGSEMQRTRVKIPPSFPRSLSLLRTPQQTKTKKKERKKEDERTRAALNSCARNFYPSAPLFPGMHQNKKFETYILFYKIKALPVFFFFS
jgi:hypothetical protein